MTELIAPAILTALLVGAVFFYRAESQAWRAERAQLLDRLMARDFDSYRAASYTTPHVDIPQLTSDQAEAAWYAAQDRVAS